ncbi:MAG: hypothetical protein ACFCVH_05810, partial [Alphaproteobacteria bacterium]
MRYTTGLVRVAACLAALLAAGSANADAPAMAEAEIGGLTLAYDASSWRVEGGDDSYAIACIAESCDGVVLDVSVASDPAGFCSKLDAIGAAEAQFAFAGGTAANIHPVGDLAVVLATRRNGSPFDSPQGAFACLTREGQVYRFQSRLGDAEPSRYTGGIVLELLRGLTAPPAAIADLQVGDLRLSYRTDVWGALSVEAGSATAVLHCLPPTCFDLGPTVAVSAGEHACDEALGVDLAYWGDGRDWPLEVDAGEPGAELTFQVDALWMGCRNATPPYL